MRNFFKKKHHRHEHESVVQEVPLSTIYRWYLYDTELVEDVNELAEMIGLSRVSDEGDSKEREESEVRVREIAPIYPYLEAISDVSAKSLVAMHLSAIAEKDEELDEDALAEQADSMMVVYKALALSSLIGAFSIGLHLGMISPSVIGSDVKEGLGDMYE